MEVRYSEGHGTDLCITFTHVHNDYSKPLPGFAEPLLTKAKMPAVYFVSRRNHWWQPQEVDEAIDQLRQSNLLDRFERRIGYGSSMGGYGVLLFARKLGLDRVVAVSPQASVNPKQVPWETRYNEWIKNLSFRQPDIQEALAGASNVTVVYDYMNRYDRRHIAMLRQSAGVEFLNLPYTGHPPLGFLTQGKQLSNFARSIFDKDFKPERWRQARRDIRTGSANYWLNLCLVAFDRRRYSICIAAAHRCLALTPRQSQAWIYAGLAHERSGNPAMALGYFTSAVNLQPEHGVYRYHLDRLTATMSAPSAA